MSSLTNAIRSLVRTPRFSVACIFTLALALSATATLLNLLEVFVFRKLAVPAPQQLLGVYPRAGDFSAGFAPATLQALESRQQALTGVCGVTASALRSD